VNRVSGRRGAQAGSMRLAAVLGDVRFVVGWEQDGDVSAFSVFVPGSAGLRGPAKRLAGGVVADLAAALIVKTLRVRGEHAAHCAFHRWGEP
jgi:hypothetical protein